MKKFTSFAVLCICCSSLYAQSSFVVCGMEASSASGSVSASIGQTIAVGQSYSQGSVLAGVQQPYVVSTLGVDNYPSITLSMSVFPNPTTEGVNLRISKMEYSNLQVSLYNLEGKQLQLLPIEGDLTHLNLQHLSTGVYVLKINDKKNTLKSFKIIKQ